MTNDGKEAETAFLKIMAARPRTAVERFRDLKDLRGLNKGAKLIDFAKPADFLVTEDRNIHYAEVKSVQSATSFPFSNLQDGQKAAAMRQAKVGGDYRFYLFSYGLGQWFLMTAARYADCLNNRQLSVKFKDLPAWQ